MLITGGSTPELEQALTEGHGLQPNLDKRFSDGSRDRCRVTLIRLDEGVLEPYVSARALLNYQLGCDILEQLSFLLKFENIF